MKGFVVFFILVAASLRKSECKNLGLPRVETEADQSEDVNKYYTLDEKKQVEDVKRFQDVSIEIDLLDSAHPQPLDQGREEFKPQSNPLVIYQIGTEEEDLPECASKNQICSKIDLYGAPWVERLCRCPGGRACPSTPNPNDGHTVEDRSKQYKFCEAVMRIPYCHFFKDVTWSLQPSTGPQNATIQRVYCKCRPGGVPYLVRRDVAKDTEGNDVAVFYFACSPQSLNIISTVLMPIEELGMIDGKPKDSRKIKCAKKEPCKLFTVKKRNKTNVAVEDVTSSALCQCPKGLQCPSKHTDPGTMPSRTYPGLDIKTYTAYCSPPHHSNRSDVFKFRTKRFIKNKK